MSSVLISSAHWTMRPHLLFHQDDSDTRTVNVHRTESKPETSVCFEVEPSPVTLRSQLSHVVGLNRFLLSWLITRREVILYCQLSGSRDGATAGSWALKAAAINQQQTGHVRIRTTQKSQLPTTQTSEMSNWRKVWPTLLRFWHHSSQLTFSWVVMASQQETCWFFNPNTTLRHQHAHGQNVYLQYRWILSYHSHQ